MSKTDKTNAPRFVASKDEMKKAKGKKSSDFTIYKADEDKQLVFGWASVIITPDGVQLEDRQNDVIDPEDLEEAAYEYVLNFRDTGEEHLPGYRKKGKLVESCVLTEEKQKAMGIPAGTLPVGWWIGFKIDDPDTWQRVKNGTYRMFSVEGKANREPVEKAAAPTGCGVLVIRDGKILTGTRIERGGHGRICGPGGHIEPGETPKEAAKREAFEEFGIRCHDLKPLGTQDGGRYGTAAVFLCTSFSGTPNTDEEEMTDPRWIDPKEITSENAFPPFMQSLDLLPRDRVAKTFRETIEKFNPFHDEKGRFSSADHGISFTTRTKDPAKQHWANMAIEREKERTKDWKNNKPPVKINYDEHGFADYDESDHHQLKNGKGYYQQQKLTSAQKQAATNYLEAHPEPGSLYSHSQNLNHKMVSGEELTGKYKETYDGVMDSMHNLGQNLTLTRYDHDGMINGMLKSLGVGSDYKNLTQKQLEDALLGKTVNENKFLSTSYNNFVKAPDNTKKIFDTRAVKVNYKASANTKAMMPGIGPGGDFGEIILAPTNGSSNRAGRIVGIRFTGKMARSKGAPKGTLDVPQIEIDIEI